MLNRLQTIRNQKNKENDDEDKLFEADEKMFDNTEINENKSDDLDKQIADVKKIKELFDAGILSEEEFNKKKKEIMKL